MSLLLVRLRSGLVPIRAAELTAAKARTASPGRYGDGDGLYLLVRTADTAFWVFRYTRSGRLREMGLGRRPRREFGYPVGSAGQSRRTSPGRACRNRSAGREGCCCPNGSSGCPAEREDELRNFRQAATEFIAGKRAEWRNSIHAGQWPSSLETYVYPHFGDIPVASVLNTGTRARGTRADLAYQDRNRNSCSSTN